MVWLVGSIIFLVWLAKYDSKIHSKKYKSDNTTYYSSDSTEYYSESTDNNNDNSTRYYGG